MTDFIDADSALAQILERTSSLGSETVALQDAGGRVLCTDIVATLDAPPFTNSAMDGVAFAFSSWSGAGNTSLEVVATIAAGRDPSDVSVGAGQAVRIMTGAPLPPGTDTVVMREEVEGEETIRFTGEVKEGQHVRMRGEYVESGVVAIEGGTIIDAGVVSLLATFGFAEVEVVRRPRVTIVTTGSELVPINEQPGPGQIRNSNVWMLAELCRSYDVEPTIAPITKDDEVSVQAAFELAIASSDVVVSVGGVSVGEFDFVRPTIENLSDTVSFWRVKMKPGKPLTHGVCGGSHLLGLPGNPMSCFVTFHVFVGPLLAKLSGDNAPQKFKRAIVSQSLRSTPKRREYITGTVVLGQFERTGKQSSGDVSAMVGCDVLAIIEEGISLIREGEAITVLELR